MKKIFAMLLVATTIFALVGCDGMIQTLCGNCGREIPVTADICEYCGAPMGEDDETAAPTTTETTVAPTTMETVPPAETTVETTVPQDAVTADNLMELLQGHWGVQRGTSFDGVTFQENTMYTWTYPGEYLPTGTITNITKMDDGFELKIFYPEREYMMDYYPAKEVKWQIYSQNDFQTTFIVNEMECTYLGTPDQSIEEVCKAVLGQ